jgi:hypothetical protein
MSVQTSYDLPPRLTELLASMFTPEELMQIGEYWPAGRPVGQVVALGGPDSAAQVAHEALGSGRVDELLLLLQEKRPLRRDEIDAMERRWLAHGQSVGDPPPEPLPLSAEMERIQQYAEGDDALAHQETTPLHLLHAMLAVHAGYDAQARLSRLIPPGHLLRTLRALARVAASEIPAGVRVVRQGYARLWAQADALAQRRSGVKVQFPDMLLAFCALRSDDVGEYLRAIGVSWASFDAMVPKPTSQVVPQATLAVPAAPPSRLSLPPLQLAHYEDVYGRFVVLKRMHGEDVSDFTLDKFIAMLHAKSAELLKQPDVVGVEFVPYVKQGKPALRANFRRRDEAAGAAAGEA